MIDDSKFRVNSNSKMDTMSQKFLLLIVAFSYIRMLKAVWPSTSQSSHT